VGLKQADAVGWRLRETEFDEIYCSDLPKCKQTVLAILKCQPKYAKPDVDLLQFVTLDPRLRERVPIFPNLEKANMKGAGSLTGKPWPDIKPALTKMCKTYEEYLLQNGGEAFDAFQDRVLEFYASVIDKHLLDPSGMSLASLMHRDDDGYTPLQLETSMTQLSLQPASPLRQLHNPNAPKSPLERKVLTVLPSPGGIHSVPENRNAVSFASVSQASMTNVIEKRASTIVFTVIPTPKSDSVCSNTPIQSLSTHKPMLSPLTIPSPNGNFEASPLPPLPAKIRKVLIVTHGGPIELLFSHLLNELACEAKEVHTGFPKGTSLYRLKINRTSNAQKDWEWRGKVETMNDVAHHALLKNAQWHQWRSPGQVCKTKETSSITAQWLASMEDEKPVYVTQERSTVEPVFTRTSSMPATPYPKDQEKEKPGGNAIKRVFKRLSNRFKSKDGLPPLPSDVLQVEPIRKKSLGW
jgi:broad specificity phosphatase PhoE